MTTFIEFPYYDDTLTIPHGWVDISWHNNACPSIAKRINDKLSVVIWCDFKDQKRREIGGDFRFVISTERFDELGEEHYEPQGGAHTFENALLFANSLFSELVVKG